MCRGEENRNRFEPESSANEQLLDEYLSRSAAGQPQFILTIFAHMVRLMMTSLVVVILAMGCKSRPLGPYVSPRVTGQVFASENDQPLAGVKVTRGWADSRSRTGSSPKGSELLMQKAPVRTDANGRFFLPSERVLSILRGSGWNTVSLTFEREGYHRFQTNFPISLATTAATGEPVLNISAIILQPAPK